jgi:pimeloyl-ACP methyl ester carboxylesterase
MKPGCGEYVDVDGVRTYYVHEGSGPTLLLLHGQPPGGSVHVIWGPTFEFFVRAGFSVYAYDQVGFGRSGHSTDHSRERRVAQARAFIEAMGFQRYSMWGMSDGSNLACRIALQDPRVERMVLMASGSLSPRPPSLTEERHLAQAAERASYAPSLANARAYLEHALMNKAAITDELVAELYAMSSGKNHEAFQARQALPATPPIYDELRRLTIPTLLLWGRNDSGGAERGLLLFEKIPGAELHIFDNCGHWVNVDQTDRVNSLVLNFLHGE